MAKNRTVDRKWHRRFGDTQQRCNLDAILKTLLFSGKGASSEREKLSSQKKTEDFRGINQDNAMTESAPNAALRAFFPTEEQCANVAIPPIYLA